MARKLGYWDLYNSEETRFRVVLCMYAALAYVPLEHIHEYYGRLSTNALTLFPENSLDGTKSITEFNEYFCRTYIGAPGSDGGIFKHKFWNVRES